MLRALTISFFFMFCANTAIAEDNIVERITSPSVELSYGTGTERSGFSIDENMVGLADHASVQSFEVDTEKLTIKISSDFPELNFGGRAMIYAEGSASFVSESTLSGGYELEETRYRDESLGPDIVYSNQKGDASVEGYDWSVFGGITFKPPVLNDKLIVRPKIGIVSSVRTFERTNGRETIDVGYSLWPGYYPVGPIADFSGSYETDSTFYVAGLDVAYMFCDFASFSLSGSYSMGGDIDGEGSRWSRETGGLDKFSHTAEVKRLDLKARVESRIYKALSGFLFATYTKTAGDTGSHKLFYGNNNSLVSESSITDFEAESSYIGAGIKVEF